MRTALTFATVALLAACTPAPSQAPADPAPPPSAAAAPDSALASATLNTGQWFYNADESVSAAGFGAPQSEYQLTLVCNEGSGRVTITSDHELVPDQATTLALITAGRTFDVPATSFNEGLPHVSGEIADAARQAELVAALSAPQERIGVDVGGDVRVYPWDESIARALAPCA